MAIISSSFVGMRRTVTLESGAEMTRSFAADLVGVLVHLNTHELEAGGDGHALGSAVLADTCGEDDGVHAAHRGGIRTDELLHAVVEHIDSKAGALIALLEGLFEIAEVGADAADAHDAGLLVEDIDHLL